MFIVFIVFVYPRIHHDFIPRLRHDILEIHADVFFPNQIPQRHVQVLSFRTVVVLGALLVIVSPKTESISFSSRSIDFVKVSHLLLLTCLPRWLFQGFLGRAQSLRTYCKEC